MSTPDPKPSLLMLDECFAAADERFLDEWVKFNSSQVLQNFMQRWLADERPWAKQQIVNYLQRDLNFPGHEFFVKRLFKHFESAGDHAMMARFMVTFDRIVRRRRVATQRWDRSIRELVREEHLFAKPNKTVMDQVGRTAEVTTGKRIIKVPLPDIRNRPSNRLFRHRTRNHLRRRAWRYFRWLSYRDPQAYVKSMTAAIIEYRDQDFAVGENIIDNWSLLHACYFHSDAISFTSAHANLARGQSLASLTAAPYRPELWKLSESIDALLQIILDARSALGRVWAMELLQRDHKDAVQRINVKVLIQLLSHSDSRVQQLASDIFNQHTALSTLPVSTWLELLEQAVQSLLPAICRAMAQNVSAARLDTAQMIQLATARPAPVAEMGFQMLRQRHGERPMTVAEIVSLSSARCESLAGELTTWALSQLDDDASYSADSSVEFFDALLDPMRSAAMDWLENPGSHGHNDPVLWARLIETPFDDVRLRVVECLHRRTSLPGAETDSMARIWCSVILGVHRGGRTKLKAMNQMQAAILDCPERAATLLPVLAVAMRSLRAPERRKALSTIASLATQSADLRVEIGKHMPELEWQDVPVV